MRGLLEAIEAVTLGISQDDMKVVSLASWEVKIGATRSGNEPMALIAKLPLEFKSLRMSVHRNFDELALEAETMGDGGIILGKLGAILNTCTTWSRKLQIHWLAPFTSLSHSGPLKA